MASRNQFFRKSGGLRSFPYFPAFGCQFHQRATGNIKLAQKLLGHSNLSTTVDIYTHASTALEREAATAIEREIFGDLFPVVPETGNN